MSSNQEFELSCKDREPVFKMAVELETWTLQCLKTFYVVDFLNRGFLLRWNADNCEECAESGCSCGFDYGVYKFLFTSFDNKL
ncbi:hypothetical protein IFM89_004831 [Coptis chinensis]|uniref:Wall-associated receptor kinase C-terminal domain-containing protein n=1 Tax=Coptis chinensis TaxID=261450 RepID=A0A835H4H9_9MAGN|nr:hypothetical protein IFM89_004831 [Coptis chinensis]